MPVNLEQSLISHVDLSQRRETTTEGPEQKHKKCIREKKRTKRQQDIERILKSSKVSEIFR